jgi:hypothetical protein
MGADHGSTVESAGVRSICSNYYLTRQRHDQHRSALFRRRIKHTRKFFVQAAGFRCRCFLPRRPDRPEFFAHPVRGFPERIDLCSRQSTWRVIGWLGCRLRMFRHGRDLTAQ